MARKPRVHYEGALYHVICRGNNREWVFNDGEDKSKYIDIIQHYKKRYGFNCYAYCVMGNHVHMLIEVGSVPLSKIMQGIQLVYTQYYNKKRNRIGHVFSQRYKAVLCNKDDYLLMLIRYIHQNPVRAGIEDGLDYEWSSHRKYIGKEANDFLSIDFSLKMFNENSKSNAVKKYLNFVNDEDHIMSDLKTEEFSEGTLDHTIIANDQTIELSLNEIAEIVASYCGVTFENLISKKRLREIARAKKVFVWLCFKHTDYQQVDMAQLLNVSQPSISKVLRIESDDILSVVEEIYSKVL